MKRLSVSLLLLSVAALPGADTNPHKPAAATVDANDVIMRAMKDEMQRSKDLALADAHGPYFLEYVVEDMTGFNVSASLGGLLRTTNDRVRLPLTKVRVGDYNFDNTNYLFSDVYSGTRFDPDRMPLDDDYSNLRRVLWLSTDRAYKTAVEAYARKKSALSNVTQSEQLPDFWKAEPVQKIDPVTRLSLDSGVWTDRVKALSKAFAKYQEILHSQVTLSVTSSTHYQLNSEGTAIRIPDGVAHITARAVAQSKDGMQVRDAIVIVAHDVNKLPSAGEIEKRVNEVAEHVHSLANAPAGETYSGPVLLEGVAAAQLFAELLCTNLTLPRKPVGEPGRTVPFFGSEFEGRIGSKVLADFLDVVDDPTQEAYNGTPLFGHFAVDEEGVVPKPVTLIEQGKLRNFLLTRQPVKGFNASNGRARLPSTSVQHAAAPGNLFIKASQTVPEDQLKQRLIDMIKQRNKPYGIIVRKTDYPSSASLNEIRSIAQSAQAAGVTRPVSIPLLVYRVYPDGHEELVRGMRFRGLTVRALKDVSAAGDRSVVFSYMYNTAPFALMDFSSFVAPVSVIAPSILFEDLDLERPQEDMPKLPIVDPPPLSASAR